MTRSSVNCQGAKTTICQGGICLKWYEHLGNYCHFSAGGVSSVCVLGRKRGLRETETWSWKVTRVCSELLWHVELCVGDSDIGSHLRQKSCPVLVSSVILNWKLCHYNRLR